MINNRLEGVWDRSATRLTLSHAHLVRDFEAAGGGTAARAQEALVEGEEGRRPVCIGKTLFKVLNQTRIRRHLFQSFHITNSQFTISKQNKPTVTMTSHDQRISSTRRVLAGKYTVAACFVAPSVL